MAFVAIAASALAQNDVFADIGVKIQKPLKELTALEADEKKLRASEDAQIFSAAAEKKQRARIASERSALRTEAEGADRIRQKILDDGCPEHAALIAAALADRCNPRIRAHAALMARLTVRADRLYTQLGTADILQAAISATVLQNSQKRKEIVAARMAATAERDRLRLLAVTEAIRRNKLAAMRACGAAACCHGVIYDGKDPKLCGLELLCQSFQKAGIFGDKNLICVPARSPA